MIFEGVSFRLFTCGLYLHEGSTFFLRDFYICHRLHIWIYVLLKETALESSRLKFLACFGNTFGYLSWYCQLNNVGGTELVLSVFGLVVNFYWNLVWFWLWLFFVTFMGELHWLSSWAGHYMGFDYTVLSIYELVLIIYVVLIHWDTQSVLVCSWFVVIIWGLLCALWLWRVNNFSITSFGILLVGVLRRIKLIINMVESNNLV